MTANIPILIIDADKSHVKLEQLILAEKNYAIRVASNSEEAIKILAEFHPRLILIEIKLPGIDGLELTRILKADPKYQDIIIIAITAYGMQSDKEKILAAGCDGYLSKPIDVETFSKMIADFINKKDHPTN